jgi:preprotein translocase YajC subunit
VYILLVFVAVLLVFSMVQNNKRRKQTATLQRAIEPGVRVMTTSGIYGIVTEVEPDTIVLEISEGVDVRFKKAAVMHVVPDLVDDADDIDDEHDTEQADDATPGTELTDADLHAELDALRAGDSAPQTDGSADAGNPSTKSATTSATEPVSKPATGHDGSA